MSPSGSGPGSVGYSVAVNETTAARQGTLGVADQILTVSQAAGPSLSIADVSLLEGNSGSVNAVCTVTLSAATSQAVSVDYATADHTAQSAPPANADFTARRAASASPPAA